MGGSCSSISSSKTTPQQPKLQPQQPQPSLTPAGPSTLNRMAVPSYNYMEVLQEGISISADHKGDYFLSFKYDAIVDGSVDIVLFGTQNGGTFKSVYGNRGTVGRFLVTSGEGETFRQRLTFDMARLDPQELSNTSNNIFPLVIGAEAAGGNPIYYLVVLESCGDLQYSGRIVRRVTRDTFGRLGEIASTYEEEGGRCIICRESYANEALLPCNHSMCSACRVQLSSQKCPICHRRIEQVLLCSRPGKAEA